MNTDQEKYIIVKNDRVLSYMFTNDDDMFVRSDITDCYKYDTLAVAESVANMLGAYVMTVNDYLRPSNRLWMTGQYYKTEDGIIFLVTFTDSAEVSYRVYENDTHKAERTRYRVSMPDAYPVHNPRN